MKIFGMAGPEDAPAGDAGELPDPNRALAERPTFSIRVKIILAFSLFFILCVILNAWSVWLMAEVSSKIKFLEIADQFMAEIQQARRYEKNFLLYGSNLGDAKAHLAEAENIIKKNSATVAKVLGTKNYGSLTNHVHQYHADLVRLSTATSARERTDIEASLRLSGGLMISFAQDFVKKERDNVDSLIAFARKAPFVFMGVLVVLMIFIASFMTRQFLSTLNRFMEYTRRIGQGDFSLIVPIRKYRDEFSELAEAFNRMIQELDNRHNILVQSHKLRAIGTLVAGVAHELNNPLNNIMLTSAMLEEDFTELPDEEKLEMVRDITRETERSQRIVRNLLDFARESETQMEPLHMDRILAESVRLVGNQIKMAKVNLTMNLEQGLPPVHGDEQMVKQVLVNLILNALDVLPAGGKIQVAARHSHEREFVEVEVKDNGPGIPEHEITRVFDPFFTTKKKGKGTGLGLSVSRGIIRKLGGYIRVKSQVGKGTVFTVLLPVTDLPSELSSGHQGPGGRSHI